MSREALETAQRERDNYASQFTLSNKWLSEAREANRVMRGVIQQWFDYETLCDGSRGIDDGEIYLAEGKRLWFKFREDAAKALADQPACQPAKAEPAGEAQ